MGRDPAVVGPVIRNTPAEGMLNDSVSKFQGHMGNPQPMAIPPQMPMPQPVSQQQANPFAGVDPRDLAKLVNVGGSSSSSRTTQRTKGLQSMPGYDLALDTAAGAQQGALEDAGEAQAQAAKQKELELGRHATALKARQTAFDAQQANVQAQITAQEAKASAIRAEVAGMKEDPDRWWSTRSAGQKMQLSMAAALSGFVQGFRGQAGPNAVVALTQQLIDRDIKLQSKQIARKGAEAATERGIVGDLYRKLGDIRQAENQGRIMLTEGLKTKLDQIGQSAAAPMARASAQQASALLDQQIIGLKNQAFQQGQDKVTTSTSSSSSSQRAPLGSVLAKIMKAKKGKPTKMPQKEMDKLVAAKDATAREEGYLKDLRKYQGKDPGVTGLGCTTPWPRRLPGTKGEALKARANNIIGLHVKALSGATAREDEVERLEPLYPISA